MANEPRITVAEFAGRPSASSGSPWEPIVGYSRAVRAGNLIAVSGTVGLNADRTYPPTLAEQTRQALGIIRDSVEALGGTLSQIVRTRMFIIDITKAAEATAVHGEFFRDIRPVSTLVQVSRLIDDRALIEIEADAIVL
ncbi:MAG TPA: RidA family protein [Candidatus Binatia bacterium]|nr:RidA family protein [Candidatus Binatia bacterium]